MFFGCPGGGAFQQVAFLPEQSLKEGFFSRGEAAGRRRVGVEVRDLKKVWIDMGISLVRVIDTKS